MRRPPKFMFLAMLVLLALLVTCGCTSQNIGNNGLSSRKYVALYQEYQLNGAVEGNVTIPRIPEPAPTPSPFDYSGSQGYVSQYPEINSSLKLFYGDYKYYTTPSTFYIRTAYGGVYEYPMTLESNLTILGVDSNGTIHASYFGRNIDLKVGESVCVGDEVWCRKETYEIIENNTTSSRQLMVDYNTSWMFENKGIFDKTNLTRALST